MTEICRKEVWLMSAVDYGQTKDWRKSKNNSKFRRNPSKQSPFYCELWKLAASTNWRKEPISNAEVLSNSYSDLTCCLRNFQTPERYRSRIITRSRAIWREASRGDNFEPGKKLTKQKEYIFIYSGSRFVLLIWELVCQWDHTVLPTTRQTTIQP